MTKQFGVFFIVQHWMRQLSWSEGFKAAIEVLLMVDDEYCFTSLSAQSWQYNGRKKPEAGTMPDSYVE